MNNLNNNKKDGGHKGMMWMMIPCLLLLGVLFLGGGTLSVGGYLWPVLIGVFVVAHIWMMFKGHGAHRDNDKKDKSNTILGKQIDVKDENKKSGCCH